jgi:esterase/lipase superfamily enzyme
VKVQLFSGLTDVVFDCAGGYFHGHTNLGVTEALGQQIQAGSFTLRQAAGMGNSSGSVTWWAGPAR